MQPGGCRGPENRWYLKHGMGIDTSDTRQAEFSRLGRAGTGNASYLGNGVAVRFGNSAPFKTA